MSLQGECYCCGECVNVYSLIYIERYDMDKKYTEPAMCPQCINDEIDRLCTEVVNLRKEVKYLKSRLESF